MSFKLVVVLYILGGGFYVPFSAGSGVPLGGGGGVDCSSPLSSLRVFFVVEGVPSVAFDAQCSPGPANSL